MSTITGHGYRVINGLYGHPLADRKGRVYEHRLVAYEKYGRTFERHENIHHINGDKLDNRPENLALVGWSEHIHEHHSSRAFITDAEVRSLILLGYGGREFARCRIWQYRVLAARKQLGLGPKDGCGPRGRNARMFCVWSAISGDRKYMTCSLGHYGKTRGNCDDCKRRVEVGRMGE